MKIEGKDMQAVWWTDEGIRFIDQRRLPHALDIALAASVEEVARAIEDMAVRGAPAIGVLGAYGLALAARRGEPLEPAHARLLRTRPTGANLARGLAAVMAAGPEPAPMLEAARAHDRHEVEAASSIGHHGLALFRKGTRVLTHCNAGWLAVQDWGTATAPIYQAARAGLAPFVYVSETRPRLQGAQLTAWELGQEGIEHTVIADGASAHFMQCGEIDLVLTGADRIAANGDVANKIGTYDKACVAAAHRIPFYVAAPLTTFDRTAESGREIPIEQRAADELTTVSGRDASGAIVAVRIAPDGARASNPAFDVTPNTMIAGLITEVGIVPATRAGVEEAFRRLAAGKPASSDHRHPRR